MWCGCHGVLTYLRSAITGPSSSMGIVNRTTRKNVPVDRSASASQHQIACETTIEAIMVLAVAARSGLCRLTRHHCRTIDTRMTT